MSDSTRPGVLTPLAIDRPENDGDLDAIIQVWVRELTGLPGDLVRPRWQPTPPPQPNQDVDWVAIGCIEQEFEATDHYGQDQADSGVLRRWETAHFLATFYGPSASGFAISLRANAQIGQNRDWLTQNGIALHWLGAANNTPVLVNEVWRGHCELPMQFRREVASRYPIRTLLTAPVALSNDPT